MAKTISLSDEAYNLLKSVKRKDESFSDVIKRLIGGRGNLIDVIDLYPELAGEKELETSVDMMRKDFDQRLGRILDEMH